MRGLTTIAAVLVAALLATTVAAQQNVTSNLRFTWDQPSTGITVAQANALVVKSYLDPGPQGPVPSNGVTRPFECIVATDTTVYTCQLEADVAALVGTNTGVHRVAISVQTRNADGSLTAEVYSPEVTFRFDVAGAGTPRNPRFAVPFP